MDMQPGDRIRELREAKRYTREVLANKVGITPKFLYEIERGRRSFSAVNLLGLAQALSVSCDYIMLGEQREKELSLGEKEISLGEKDVSVGDANISDEQKQGIAKLINTLESLEPEKIKRIQELLETLDAICDMVV